MKESNEDKMNLEWGGIGEEDILVESTSKYMKMSNKIWLGMSAR